MGIFSSIFKARDKPQNSTAGTAWRFYLGNSSSNKLVTERSSMQVAAVYACVRVLSEAVTGLPVHLYRCSGDGSKEKAMDHPLYFLLHDEPNPEMSSFVFRETLMTHLLLWRNGYRSQNFSELNLPVVIVDNNTVIAVPERFVGAEDFRDCL